MSGDPGGAPVDETVLGIVDFPIVRRGYAPDSVRAFVSAAHAELRRLTDDNARLRARIRRPGNAAAPQPRRDRWRLQPVERRLLRPDGTVLDLTTAEFELLAVMAAQPGEVQTREALTQLVFRRPWRPGDRAVDNAVLHLRQKLAPELGERCIVTIRQVGYVFIGFPNS